MNVVIDGVPYVPDPEWPNDLSVWYMHDNHTFTRLYGTTLEAILGEASRVEAENPYGLLGKIFLNRDGKEVRRVGTTVHSMPNRPEQWQHAIEAWRKTVEADPHVLRLLHTNAKPL